MVSTTERVVIAASDAGQSESLRVLLQGAGYEVMATESLEAAVAMLRAGEGDVVLLGDGLADTSVHAVLTSIESAMINLRPRVILLSRGDAARRALWLDQGADEVVSVPYEAEEVLARVRNQMRLKRSVEELARKVQNAEESYQVAQTAFQALAVTEKMTRDAFSLERVLKIGVGALFGLALVIAGIFFLYSHKAEKETRRAYSVISQLERSVKSEEELLASARRLREDPSNTDVLQQKEQLQQKSNALRQKLAAPDGSDVNELRRELEETTNRLTRLEGNSQAAQGVIRDFAPSVCLLHVAVAFNDKDSGRRVRYGGIDSDGSPLKDSDGNTVYTTEGRAPEVRADFFGTGFIAGEGKILTNHHVVQPWWQNEELGGAAQQGLEPVIAEMTAYFPGVTNGIPVGISQISEAADLALVHGDLSELRRPILKLDARKEAAVSGEELISVGYATGLDAILARAGEDAVNQIVKVSGGDPKLVLGELAKRKLIRPLVTQGHVGDVLPDKIVYDAQTTSGGSGGPLLNSQGGVIGVTFAVVRGFGGSNFGVPIHYALPLLKR
ncbi:MAG TPA: trypsin-like peptidase domain-containing protein [Candidatus Sulfotelmatobacter sp.]|nr:trypsin-like peptidase domain-containing protein [Candidatus Sulfotelmatobacter sp.]